MFKICKKDLKLFFSDLKAVLLTFLLPVILTSLFVFAYSGMDTGKTKSRPITLPVSDLDNSPAVQKAVATLDSVMGLVVEPLPLDEAREKVITGKKVGVLIFHEGFSDSILAGSPPPLELLYDEAREMEVGILRSVLTGAIMKETGLSHIKTKVLDQIRKNYADLEPEILNEITAGIDSFFNQSSDSGQAARFMEGSPIRLTPVFSEQPDVNLGLIQAVAGTAVMMLLFSVSAIGAGLLEEKEAGTLKRLFYSPIRPSDILYGKMLAGFLLAVLQLSVMFIFAWIVFGLDLSANIPGLVAMVLSTALACSGFGIFLAAISDSRQQVQSLSTIIILIMSAIGGSMIPLFVMPAIMQKVAVFSVNYWGIQGFFDIFWRHLPLVDVLKRAAVLFFTGLAMMTISVRLFNKNVTRMI